jgi:hypothetical protein
MPTVFTKVKLTVPLSEARQRAADPETSANARRGIKRELKKVHNAAVQIAREIMYQSLDAETQAMIAEKINDAISIYEQAVNDASEQAAMEFNDEIAEVVTEYGYEMCLGAVEATDAYGKAQPDNADIDVRGVLDDNNDYGLKHDQWKKLESLTEELEAAAVISAGSYIEFPDLELDGSDVVAAETTVEGIEPDTTDNSLVEGA